MSANNLVALAREGAIEPLEELWKEHLTEPGEISQYRKTVDALCEHEMASKALHLSSSMVDALIAADRRADAANLAMATVRRGAHNDALAQKVYGLMRELHGDEPWFGVVQDLAKLDPESVSGDALQKFARLRSYTVGNVLYHRAGWGEGLVEEFRADSREVVVRFASGSVKDLPLSTALDSLQPLDPDDLRCMLLTSRDELERLAVDEPAALIRKAARVFRGRATSTQVKGKLCPAVVATKKWAAFWKRAKAAAAIDPWLQVEGSATRPVFELRTKPLSLSDEARRSVLSEDDLGGEIATLRGYVDRCNNQDALSSILDLVQERLEIALAPDSKQSHAHILDGILLLETHEREVPTSATGELRQMLLPEDGSFAVDAFERLATQDAREHAVRLIPEAIGDDWADLCLEHMTVIPASVAENIVDLMVERKAGDRLLTLWDKVAPYPRRHPFLTYLVGKLYADKKFDKLENRPDEITVIRVLLHLARTLASDRKGSTQKGRLLTRVTSLLTGRRNFLKSVLEDIDRENLASFLGITERGGDDFPQEITTIVLRTVADKAPELTAVPDRPFWEENIILATRAGLERRQEEQRMLTEVKIPENAKAINEAASHGDLSENAEWDAAMEDQRNLTARAQISSEELALAALIADYEIPNGIVSPGTRVTWEITENDHTDKGTSQSARVLGPWDMDGDDVINYRAPLGKRLLGRKIGDTTQIPSPDGDIEVKILEIEMLEV